MASNTKKTDAKRKHRDDKKKAVGAKRRSNDLKKLAKQGKLLKV
jgi:hypothetical protein